MKGSKETEFTLPLTKVKNESREVTEKRQAVLDLLRSGIINSSGLSRIAYANVRGYDRRYLTRKTRDGSIAEYDADLIILALGKVGLNISK